MQITRAPWQSLYHAPDKRYIMQSRENAEIMAKVRTVFAEWYDNGHTNEEDPNTCLLRVRLTEGVLYHHGTRYDIDFQE